MTTTQGELASLSRYIFRAPVWYSSVGFALLIAALVGVAAFESAFLLDDAYQGLFFIGIPTLVAAFLTAPVDRRFGGQLTYNRSSLLALVSEGIVVVMLAAAGGIALLTPLAQRFVFDVLIESLAIIFAFRLAVVMAVSHRNPAIAAIPASLQTLSAGVLLFVYSGTLRYLEVGGPIIDVYLSRSEEGPAILAQLGPTDFQLLIVMSLLYSAAVWGLINVIDRPWRRSLGVSGLDFLRGFIGHIAEGTDELELFFEEIGEEAVVPVTVLSFARPDGTEKARFVLPMIHPGPMGEIGGGNLPRRVAEDAEGLAFPPHATAGHDFNLVTKSEVEELIRATKAAGDRIEYDELATPSVRAAAGEASVLGQAFDDDGLLVATFAPGFADDIEYGVGMSAMGEARVAGLDDVLLADAHNSNDGLDGGDLGHVTPGSRRSLDLFRATREAAEELVAAPRDTLALGTAWEPTDWAPEDGIGPLGIRVALVRVGEQTTAYVLIDGNNMEPGLREQVLDTLEEVDAAEVMTTDTHIVNTVESTNQVGQAIDRAALVDAIHDLVEQARADLEPVKAGMATEHAEVTVFGNDRTETLASHANAVISMGGALAGAVVIATVAVSILVFLFTSA
jgi:putative membrane protein